MTIFTADAPNIAIPAAGAGRTPAVLRNLKPNDAQRFDLRQPDGLRGRRVVLDEFQRLPSPSELKIAGQESGILSPSPFLLTSRRTSYPEIPRLQDEIPLRQLTDRMVA